MSEIFEKNTNIIAKYNPALANKLKNTELTNFELNTNLAGEYNLIIDAKPVHSVTGAQAEAEEIFQKVEHDTKNVIHLIYGMGLGYLFDKFAGSAKGDVILFEPDLKLLRFVLEIIDMNRILSRPNVFVASDFEELTAICSKIYKYKRQIFSYALDFYKFNRHDEFARFQAFVKKMYGELYQNHFYQTNRMHTFLPEMLKSLDVKAKLPLFSDLAGKFQGCPAVIVSAGPSLVENIDILKKQRSKVLIFAVGTALKVLLDNGIAPDFVNYIESYSSESFFEGVDTEKLNIIVEPYSSCDIYTRKFKNIFLTTSYESNVNHLFAEICGFELPYFEAKGTVAYHSLFCAKVAGCSQIFLLGQDLAYLDGRCYAKGSIYEDLRCVLTPEGYKIDVSDREKLKKAFYSSMTDKSDAEKEEILNATIARMNDSLCTVPGVDGKPVPTSVEYKSFIANFEYFAAQNKNLELFNLSNGANITGFAHDSAKNAFENLKFDLNISIPPENTMLTPCASAVLPQNLKKNIEIVKKALQFLSVFKEYSEKCDADMEKLLDMYEKFKPVRNSSLILSILTLSFYNKTEYLLRDEAKNSDPEWLLRVLRGFGRVGVQYAQTILPIMEESLRKMK